MDNSFEARRSHFIERAIALWGYVYDYSDMDFSNLENPCYIRCRKHGIFKVSRAGEHLHSKENRRLGCPYCKQEETGRLTPRLKEERAKQKEERKRLLNIQREQMIDNYLILAKLVHGDKYDYSKVTIERIVGKKNGLIMKNIICPVHGPYDTRVDVHVYQGCDCPKCKKHPNNISAAERGRLFIENVKKRFAGKFSYRHVVYVNNDTPVKIYCKEHHFMFECTPDTHIRKSGGCPYCTKSVGEVEIYRYLKEHDIEFLPQYRIQNENKSLDLQYLVADFYLPNHNLVIEMNGEQHYKSNTFFNKGKRTFELQQMRDETLRTYLREHGIGLLEIRYDEQKSINEILDKVVMNNNAL